MRQFGQAFPACCKCSEQRIENCGSDMRVLKRLVVTLLAVPVQHSSAQSKEAGTDNSNSGLPSLTTHRRGQTDLPPSSETWRPRLTQTESQVETFKSSSAVIPVWFYFHMSRLKMTTEMTSLFFFFFPNIKSKQCQPSTHTHNTLWLTSQTFVALFGAVTAELGTFLLPAFIAASLRACSRRSLALSFSSSWRDSTLCVQRQRAKQR